ncbi:CDC50-like protein [Vairimorpha necatrix]|uniref:CDC50-like protein n=1 Tax=Vairimorpha necatrix TaxID=6039 RepID=A0AAX4JC01_9MICR
MWEGLKNIQDDILRQKVKGSFIDPSLSKHSPLPFLFSLLSLIMGCIMTYTYYNIYEISIDYSSTNKFYIYLPKSTVYFYIQIDNFYQSNLKYSKSISYDQLKGERDTNSSMTSPLDYKNGKVYYPAGILPNTFLQDKFTIKNLEINQKDISYKSMRKKIKKSGYERNEVIPPPSWRRYKKIPDLYKNQRFINWIYTAPFYSFRKLWGVIKVEKEGVYELEIESRFPYGNKKVFFSESSWVGTKNYFLSYLLIIMGTIGIIFTYFIYQKVFD